jgi:hypothetical protein
VGDQRIQDENSAIRQSKLKEKMMDDDGNDIAR